MLKNEEVICFAREEVITCFAREGPIVRHIVRAKVYPIVAEFFGHEEPPAICLGQKRLLATCFVLEDRLAIMFDSEEHRDIFFVHVEPQATFFVLKKLLVIYLDPKRHQVTYLGHARQPTDRAEVIYSDLEELQRDTCFDQDVKSNPGIVSLTIMAQA